MDSNEEQYIEDYLEEEESRAIEIQEYGSP
jgi:hypothetical protein